MTAYRGLASVYDRIVWSRTVYLLTMGTLPRRYAGVEAVFGGYKHGQTCPGQARIEYTICPNLFFYFSFLLRSGDRIFDRQ